VPLVARLFSGSQQLAACPVGAERFAVVRRIVALWKTVVVVGSLLSSAEGSVMGSETGLAGSSAQMVVTRTAAWAGQKSSAVMKAVTAVVRTVVGIRRTGVISRLR